MTRAQPLRQLGSEWDVVVIGAGPSGCLAARGLARARHRVLLAEKTSFPRYKVCGCCLSPEAVAVLREEGLSGVLSDLSPEPLQFFRLGFRRRQARIRLTGGVAVARAQLDAALASEAQREGAIFCPQTTAVVRESRYGSNVVQLKRGRESQSLRAKLVVCADGLGGTAIRSEAFDRIETAGSYMGAGCLLDDFTDHLRPGTIYMALGREGYVGMVRLRDSTLNVAAAFDLNALRKAATPGILASRLVAEAGFPVPTGLQAARWTGTRRLTFRRRRVAGDGVLILGDSAGYVEPFTGEGIGWALRSARSVTPIAEDILRGADSSAFREWQQYQETFNHRQQRVCRILTATLRHSLLAYGTVTAMRILPAGAEFLLHFLGEKGVTGE